MNLTTIPSPPATTIQHDDSDIIIGPCKHHPPQCMVQEDILVAYKKSKSQMRLSKMSASQIHVLVIPILGHSISDMV